MEKSKLPVTFNKNYKPRPTLLRDRIVLVTGAGDGIGRSCAKAFAKHGATVILLGRTVRKLERVYDDINSTGGPQPAIYPMDLLGAKASDYHDLACRILREYGRIDGIVHNAALLGALMPIEHYDLKMWSEVIHVNLTAPMMLTQACLSLLRLSQDASVIFTSSGVGRQGRAYWGAYAVSKFATEGFMQVLADETDNSAIRVNCINPGAVRTRMRASAYPAENPQSLISPDEVMNPYLYLMGPDSNAISGTSIDAQ